MTRKDEEYLFEDIKQIKQKVRENNIMLRQIIKVINVYIARHHKENEDDFNRNILANFISNGLDFSKLFNRK